MPSILELFRGSTFDTDVDSKSQEGKGTTFSQIKSFAEQELTGLRVKSAVELNNPLIYGNEATRIALRSTPLKDKQIDSRRTLIGNPDKLTGGATDANSGGLIGKGLDKITGGNITSLSGLRDKVNEKLGVPQTQIPSRYFIQLGNVKEINDSEKGYLQTLADIKAGGAGKGIGKFLSGGNPKTVLKQSAGNALKEAKKELRNTLFGKSSEPTSPPIKTEVPNVYDRGGASYTKVQQNQDLVGESGTNNVEFGILKTYKAKETTLAQIRVGGVKPKSYKRDSNGNNTSELLNDDIIKNRDERIKDAENKLLVAKGFSNKDDVINQSGIYDGGTDKETAIKHELDTKDFIPLYFRNIVTGETVHFRGTITGLSETVTPSWDGAKFAGNPFSYYTYTGIERNVSFNFTIYPMNSAELANNWTKIEFLTSLTYPLGYQGGQIGAVRAPIVYFTMGDLYKDKESFIDSLQYTIPDNSNWQLDGKQTDYESSDTFFSENGGTKVDVDKGYKLPHLIEVAITMKFIEQRANTEDRKKLYSFKSITY